MNTNKSKNITEKIKMWSKWLSSNLSNQTDSNESGEEIKKEVKDTPFTIIQHNNELKVTMGQNLLKSGFKTVEEAEKYIKSKPWELMLTANAVFYDSVKAEMQRLKEETLNNLQHGEN